MSVKFILSSNVEEGMPSVSMGECVPIELSKYDPNIYNFLVHIVILYLILSQWTFFFIFLDCVGVFSRAYLSSFPAK